MIVFIFVPGLYAAVEQSDDPSLRGRPVIVGGDPAKRGRVTSASREARARGVEEGMETRRALELCPDAVLRRTRVKRYRELVAELRELLRAESERLEDLGLDGTLVQLAAGVDPLARAAELCVRLQAELGVAAVAGIGPTRFVAVQAARHAGAGGIRRVRDDEVASFLGGLPVRELWGLGPATEQKLAERGVRTIGELRALDAETLGEIAGARAAGFLEYAQGKDRASLPPKPRSRTLSQEQTLDEPSVDLRALAERIERLAERLAHALARERRDARTVSLSLSFLDGTQSSRTQTLDAPTGDAARLAEAGQALLLRTQAGARAVRRLRLALGGLERAASRETPRQLRLF
jgi:DNA polymerase-4